MIWGGPRLRCWLLVPPQDIIQNESLLTTVREERVHVKE